MISKVISTGQGRYDSGALCRNCWQRTEPSRNCQRGGEQLHFPWDTHLVYQQTTEETKLKTNCQVLEECGYEVEASRLEHVVTCPASVGTGGTSQTIFSLEVHFFTAYRVKRDLGKKFLPGDRKGQERTGRWGCRGGRVHRCCGDGSGGGENAATSWPKFDFQHPGEKLSGPGEGEQPCWVSLCSPVVSPQQNAFIRGLLLQLTCLSVFAHW